MGTDVTFGGIFRLATSVILQVQIKNVSVSFNQV